MGRVKNNNKSTNFSSPKKFINNILNNQNENSKDNYVRLGWI